MKKTNVRVHHGRKYHFNEKFFDKWSSNMAYVLGFITADGSVSKYTLSIDLAAKDKEHLEKIKKLFKYKGDLNYRKKTNSFRLRLNSVYMINKLNLLGIFPSKTGNETVPKNLPLEYIGDYIRGIFDGDGSVSLRRNTITTEIVSSSENFLKSLRKLANNIGRIRCKDKRKAKPLYSWDQECNSSKALKNLMYTDNNQISLERKKCKFFSQYYIPSENRWTIEELNFLNLKIKQGLKLKSFIKDFPTKRSKKSIQMKIFRINHEMVRK